MSLHAELTPEAQARLDAMHRNSTVSSVVCGILGVVLIALTCAFIGIKVMIREHPTIVAYEPPERGPDDPKSTKLRNPLNQTPAAPSPSRAPVITADTLSPTSVPTIEFLSADPSLEYGDGDDDFGKGGIGNNPGGPPFGHLPERLRKRCSQEDRLQRLQEHGGTEKCEEAVVRALDWLQKTQNNDGSWENSNKSAMTGLALLAYLGHCETPLSEKYSDTVLRAMTYLIDLGMRNNGKLIPRGQEKGNGWVYEHGIATYALGEATTFCKELGINVPDLQTVTQQAGQFIIDNQHQSGGWDYRYSEDSGRGGDLSVTAWQIQALKACHQTGLDFRNMRPCISKAMAYVEARAGDSGGFSYTGKANGHGKYWNLTGAGMLCLQMWDKGSAGSVRAGGKYLRKHSKFKYADKDHGSDLYCHYYESQAMMNRGGEYWDTYNRNFRDEILAAQDADGSFKASGSGKHGTNRVHYRTCLCTLMLEVYYRFLPSTGGDF
jgi:hypothetical protein